MFHFALLELVPTLWGTDLLGIISSVEIILQRVNGLTKQDEKGLPLCPNFDVATPPVLQAVSLALDVPVGSCQQGRIQVPQ